MASLKTHVDSIFGYNLEGPIKYIDEENHLVTISSDEELAFAVQLHGNKVLHLEISFSSPKSDDIRGREDKRGNSSSASVELASGTEDSKHTERKSEANFFFNFLGINGNPLFEGNSKFAMKLKKAAMKKELKKDKSHVKSLAKTVKALHVLSKHGISAGISLDSEKEIQTKASLVVARNQLATKKLALKQHKQLLSIIKVQQKIKEKKEKKDKKKEKKEKKKKEKQEKKDKKEDNKDKKNKLEKKLAKWEKKKEEKKNEKEQKKNKKEEKKQYKELEMCDATN